MMALHILVLEDDALLAMFLADVLEGMGHVVCASVATEADAVAAAVRCKPDLMIVDIRLGEDSGVAAVEKIQRTQSIPHLFISGDISRIKALKPDAVAIQKPFRELDLARAIERVLGVATAA